MFDNYISRIVEHNILCQNYIFIIYEILRLYLSVEICLLAILSFYFKLGTKKSLFIYFETLLYILYLYFP